MLPTCQNIFDDVEVPICQGQNREKILSYELRLPQKGRYLGRYIELETLLLAVLHLHFIQDTFLPFRLLVFTSS